MTTPARAAILATVLVGIDVTLVALRAGQPARLLGALAALLLGEALLRTGPARFPLGAVRPGLAHVARVALAVLASGAVLALLALIAVRLLGTPVPLEPANVRTLEYVGPWLWHACVLAPLVEELVYRGALLPALQRALPRWPAFLVCGLAFWAFHWVSWGRVTPVNQLFAGVLLSWSADRTRGLLAPILLHALGNLLILAIDLCLLLWGAEIAALLG